MYSASEYLGYKKPIVTLFPNCNFLGIIQKAKFNFIEYVAFLVWGGYRLLEDFYSSHMLLKLGAISLKGKF